MDKRGKFLYESAISPVKIGKLPKRIGEQNIELESFSPLLIPAPEGADNMLIRIAHGYFYLIF